MRFTYWLTAVLSLPVTLMGLFAGFVTIFLLLPPAIVVALFVDRKYSKPLGDCVGRCVRAAMTGNPDKGNDMGNHAGAMMQDQIEGAQSENKALRQEVERLRAALEGQWLVAHDDHCTNMRDCASFEGTKECRHPRPRT